MADIKTWTGGCHCGAVRFEVQSDLSRVITCNCSICSKVGSILSFAQADQFKLLSGEEQLTDYLFNKHTIHHFFCKVCGIRSFAQGSIPTGQKVYAVNVRCLDDIDLSSLHPMEVDGKSR